MAKKILNVVDVAYRATMEEQDDTVLWISAVLKGNGGDVSVLLRGAAVNYTMKTQDASGLSFGRKQQTQPPRLADDVSRLIARGLAVLYVEDDARERGLVPSEHIPGIKAVKRADLPVLFGNYDQVWKW